LTSKRKLESENSYNKTLKDKVEDKILNLLNDFEEFKGIINTNFDEVKKFENFLNEFLKTQFSKILKFSFDTHKRLFCHFEALVGIKISLFNKIKQILVSGNETLKNIEIDYTSNGFERRYSELKNVKFGMKLFLLR
jgi:vacuolar-type H+-ATPase subunit D/Vma8